MVETYLELLNHVSDENVLYDCHPSKSFFEEGTFSFFLKFSSVIDVKDLTVDAYSPWTGKTLDGKRVTAKHTHYQVDEGSDGFYLSSVGNLTLKVVTNTHPKDRFFKRKIAYILNDCMELVTDVYFSYIAEISLTAPVSSNRRIMPSDSVYLKETMNHRRTNETKKLLCKSGTLHLAKKIPSISRSVKTHVKSKNGRTPTTRFYEIMDRYLKNNVPEEIILKPDVDTKRNGKVVIRTCVLFKNALRSFGSGLPYITEFKAHLESVALLDSQSVEERTEYFDSFLRLTDKSGSLGHLGSCIMIDTTFDLANEYVTIICGVNSQTKSSGKNSSIILGYMLHSEKTLENHEVFSRFLNSNLEKYAPHRCIPCLITDGEESLFVYKSGSYFKDCVRVRCDVHRWHNIQTMAKQENIDLIDLQQILYGRKFETPVGVVLRKGVFGALVKKEFDDSFARLLSFLEHSKVLKEWFITNREDLFQTNSMRKKLEAGCVAQYHSTNILENRNAKIKLIITSKKSGNDVIEDFLFIHKSEMIERKNSVMGLVSSLTVQMPISNFEYLAKNVLEQRSYLGSFGLNPLSDNENPVLAEFLQNLKEDIIKDVSLYNLYSSAEDETVFFVVKQMKSVSVMVTVKNEKFLCYAPFCLRARTKHKLCCHKVVVMMSCSYEAQLNIASVLRNINRTRGCLEMMTEQQRREMGSKIVRRGRTQSANNENRAYTHLLNSTDEAIDLASQDININLFERERNLSFNHC